MEKLYRKLGILTLSLTLFLITALAFYIRKESVTGPLLIKVNFENIGTLILQDPVTLKGVRVGQVYDLQYSGNSALVTLQLYNKLDLPQDSRFINVNHSLMGARKIDIHRGVAETSLDFNKVHEGIFEPGIAEMLYKSENMLNLVESYQKLLNQFLHGDSSQASVIALYRDHGLQLNMRLNKLSEELRHWGQTLSQLSQLGLNTLKSAQGSTAKLKADAPGLIDNTQKIIKQTHEQATRVDSLLHKIQGIQIAFLDPHSPLYPLIINDSLIISLTKTQNQLNALLKILSREGANDLIKSWKNIKVWGKNPSKKSSHSKP